MKEAIEKRIKELKKQLESTENYMRTAKCEDLSAQFAQGKSMQICYELDFLTELLDEML